MEGGSSGATIDNLNARCPLDSRGDLEKSDRFSISPCSGAGGSADVGAGRRGGNEAL